MSNVVNDDVFPLTYEIFSLTDAEVLHGLWYGLEGGVAIVSIRDTTSSVSWSFQGSFTTPLEIIQMKTVANSSRRTIGRAIKVANRKGWKGFSLLRRGSDIIITNNGEAVLIYNVTNDLCYLEELLANG